MKRFAASQSAAARPAPGKRRVMGTLIALACCVGASPAASFAAASYPSGPIRVIVPFPAGGGGDILARLVLTRVGEKLKQTMVIENISGAGGNVGSQTATRAAADGYTLLYGTNGTFAINQSLYKTPGFHPLDDFTPISQFTRIGALLVVRNESKITSFAQLLDTLKANPGKLTFASAGNGTTSHLAGELLQSSTGTAMVHVPYRGGAAAITDIIGGQVDLMIDVMPNTAPQVRSGRLRALGVSTARRSPAMPDVPTIAELGVAGYDVSAWDGLAAPKGTPRPVIERLQAAVKEALSDEDIKEQLISRGAEAVPSSSQDFTQFIKTELDRWGALVKRSGARVD